jgi:hypothetical protein
LQLLHQTVVIITTTTILIILITLCELSGGDDGYIRAIKSP